MPRIRTIKPEISFHEGLYDLEIETGFPIRFIWSVLPCHCDRLGRFKVQSRSMKAQIIPYDNLDFSRVIHALATRGFIKIYASETGVLHAYIPTFLKHQHINNKEKDSDLPEPNKNNTLTREEIENHAYFTRESRVPEGREGKGREGNSKLSDDSSAREDHREVIAMLPDWVPKPDQLLVELLASQGFTPELEKQFLLEFKTRHLNQGTRRMRREWDKSFVNFCQGKLGEIKNAVNGKSNSNRDAELTSELDRIEAKHAATASEFLDGDFQEVSGEVSAPVVELSGRPRR